MIGLLVATLLVTGCGASDVVTDPPADTTEPSTSRPTSEPTSEPTLDLPTTTEETSDPKPSDSTPSDPESSDRDPPTPSDAEVVESIEPILSSALDDAEFDEGAMELFGARRIFDTDDLRSEFVELAGGPADRLDDVDLDAQFVLVATTGQCVIPTTPPTLVIGVDDAVVVDVEADGDRECYRPLTVVHFFAVDDGYRDRFPSAIADLDGVISSSDTLGADDVTPDLLDRITEPTFVEGDADFAALASEVVDEDTRARVTSFAHQAKLLVPVAACVPEDVTVRVRLFEEAAVDVIDPGNVDCEVAERFIAVFSLGDGVRDRLRSTAPPSWGTGVAGDGLIVTPSGPQSIFVGAAAVGTEFDDLETQKFSTPESLAGSTLGADFDVDVSSTAVDLDTQFVVVVVRRDCDVLTDGNGIIIEANSWEISPPLPETLDCDQPNVSITTYVVGREHLGLFEDVPEGQR